MRRCIFPLKIYSFALSAVIGVFISTSTLADTISLGSAANYGILYEGNGGKTLSFNNSTEVGNVGIGGTGAFQGNGPGSITGVIGFSAGNTGQFSNSGLTLNPSTPMYGITDVMNALATANSLSQSLGLLSGTSTTISSGGSVTATVAGGTTVFNVTNISFANGTFTVNGGAGDYVVLNIAGGVGNNGLNGSVVLAGGITSDHVVFNYTPSTSNLTNYNNAYSTLTGGPTLTISTNGATTTGVFLDPTGDFSINHTVINGRIIGGDTQNVSFVSGANLTAPVVPLPSSVSAGLFAHGVDFWPSE